ncbi:MAG: ABC transporter substrate binding protein [Pseudomonadota bacterium]
MTIKVHRIALQVILLVLLLCGAVVFNLQKPRVMILHSYNTDYSWTKEVNVGLNRVFENHPGYTLNWHYMDTKRFKEEEALRRSQVTAKQAIDEFEPDILIAIDNNAQKYVAKDYVNDPNMKIIFAGINGSIEPYGYKTANNVTGILENRPLKALREVILSIQQQELGSSNNKQDDLIRLLYLMDGSRSVLSDRQNIDRYQWSPLSYVGSIVTHNFVEWQQAVLASENKTDYIIVTNYRQLSRSEIDPSLVSPKEVMSWTEKNSPVPVIGLQGFNVEDGCMLSIGTSPFEQGEVSARMAVGFIDEEKSIEDIPVESNRQFIVSMKKSSIQRHGIGLPAIYEAFSRAMNKFYD